MRNHLGPVLIVVACLCIATPGFAGIQPGQVSLSPYFGGYTFDHDLHLNTKPVYGLRLGYDLTTRWGVEAALDYVSTTMETTGDNVRSFGYRLEGLYHFMPHGTVVPFLAAGIGGTNLRGSGAIRNEIDTLVDYGAGLKIFLSQAWAVRADVRNLLVLDGGRSDFEYTLGLTYLFGGTKAVVQQAIDSDGDGVMDQLDKCPATPKGAKVDTDGCPLDRDGDGVPDYLDKCPDTPKGVKVDKDGCPVPAAAVDSDGDGVIDSLDKCPDTPKGVKVDKDGCPPDADGDGVPDYLDVCPDTPKGVAIDNRGCPLDTDGDGVPDYLDKCPDTQKGATVDKDGCPLPAKVSISLEMEFDSGKAHIKPQYDDRLKKVADFMNTYPQTTAVIEGHTDNVGSEASNQKLSARRAESVRKYLIDKFGIAAGRLTAKGFGSSRPIADNATPEGRQKNRRIDAVIESTTKR